MADVARNLQERVAALEAAMRRSLLVGRVKEVRRDPYLAQVDVGPADGPEELTGFVPVLQPRLSAILSAWAPVAEGETGLLLSPAGKTASGFFVPAVPAASNPAPVAGGERESVLLGEWPGGSIRVDLLTGAVSLAGNLRVVGSVSVSGDMSTDPKGSYNGHTHGYQFPEHPAGSAQTEAPRGS